MIIFQAEIIIIKKIVYTKSKKEKKIHKAINNNNVTRLEKRGKKEKEKERTITMEIR